MATPDFIAPNQEKELFSLKRRRRFSAGRLIVIAILSLLLVGVLSPLFQKHSDHSLARTETEVIAFGSGFALRLIDDVHRYQSWIQTRGYAFEHYLFSQTSNLLLQFVTLFPAAAADSANPLSLSSMFQGSVSGALRGFFLIISGWRLWIIALLGAFIWNFGSRRVHQGDDLLGQTGNGKLFFSGIRAALENISSDGTPDKQVVGLACLKTLSINETMQRDLWKLLDRFGAANETNAALAGIIGHYRDYPAYLAEFEEETFLANFFDTNAKLEQGVNVVLRKCLALHAAYRGEGSLDGDPKNCESEKLTLAEYGDALEGALHRVLTASLRESLASLSAAEVATAILAAEAGKIMTYAFEGGKWIRKSAYPQLNARAVLHSIPSFGSEYKVGMRSMIRRALIYATRSSEFGLVRFPLDFTDDSRALRQWMELLMAVPHRLQSTADEVELFGIVCECHARWKELFLARAMALDAEVVDDAFASRNQLLFLPIRKVVSLMREIVDPVARRRLEDLVAIVSQRQKLELMSLEFSDQAGDGAEARPAHEKIMPPLSFTEQKELAALHGLAMSEIRDWSAFRIILESFSWLGRRVGDYTVPASSVIFGAFKVPEGTPGRNPFGYVGSPGMVALRGTRLEEHWGKFWYSRFRQVDEAMMSETKEEYERQLKGIKDVVIEDPVEPTPAVGQ